MRELQNYIAPPIMVADGASSAATTTYVDMSEFDEVLFAVEIASGSTGALTKIEVIAATASNGAGATVKRTDTIAGGPSAVGSKWAVPVRVGELSSGVLSTATAKFNFVAIKVTGPSATDTFAIRSQPKNATSLGWTGESTLSNSDDQV